MIGSNPDIDLYYQSIHIDQRHTLADVRIAVVMYK